jgi:hypothetical protein
VSAADPSPGDVRPDGNLVTADFVVDADGVVTRAWPAPGSLGWDEWVEWVAAAEHDEEEER